MQNSKLVQLFKSFSQSEITEFGKFVNSPFHNESQKLINLYTYLKKFYPKFEDKKFMKEEAYSSMYGSDKYNDKKLRDRFSDLLRLSEEYLAMVNLKKLSRDEKILTLYEYKDRGLLLHFEKKFSEIRHMIGKSKVLDIQVLYDSFLIEAIKGDFAEYKNLLGKRKNSNVQLEYEVENFIKFFVTKMLLYYITMGNWAMHTNHKFDYKLYEPIMKFVEENKLNEPPILRAAYLMLKMEEDKNNEEFYFELKKLFKSEVNSFSIYDKTMVAVTLYNYAQKRYMEGNEKFSVERFEQIKLQLLYKTFSSVNGFIQREQYINAILIPISLNKTDWAEKFAEEYKDKIKPENREDTLAFASASLMHAKKKYGEALEKLAAIKDVDYIYYFRIKTLQAKIYFEQKDFEKLLSLIDSFKHYITGNPLIPNENVARYKNFIGVLYSLTMLAIKNDEYKLSKLIRKINNFSYYDITTNKSWLLEKAYDLQKNKY